MKKVISLLFICFILVRTQAFAQLNLYDSLIIGKQKEVSSELQKLILPNKKFEYQYVFGSLISNHYDFRLCYYKLETHPTPYDYDAFLASFSNTGQIVDSLAISLGDYFTDFTFTRISEDIIELKLVNIKIDNKIYSSQFYKDIPDYIKNTEIVGDNYILDNSPSEFKVVESSQTYFHISKTGYIQTLANYYESNFNRKYAFVSNTRTSKNELTPFSKQQLRIMRNEVFAKYGYIFNSKELQDIFSVYSWYTPRYNDVNKYFSEIEKYNVKLILELETSNN